MITMKPKTSAIFNNCHHRQTPIISILITTIIITFAHINNGPTIPFAQAQQQDFNDFVTTTAATATATATTTGRAGPKPALVLIVPQSLKVPTNPYQDEDSDQNNKLKQYVAVINNAQNEREDQLIRERYNKLSLQVRDAKNPISGQLFYETIFDYFPSTNPKRNYLLIPLNLDQVSPISVNNTSKYNDPSSISKHPQKTLEKQQQQQSPPSKRIGSPISQPQEIIVSIRPYQKSTGFGSNTIEFVSSQPILVESVPSSDGRRSFSVIQTDKPVYKPNERVKIRALIVNENLRPIIGDELKIQIKNPQKLIVEEIRFPKASNRSLSLTLDDQPSKTSAQKEPIYLDHEFEFPPEPMLGTWSVHLVHNDPLANDTISFEVKEYVLPPFEIVFEMPKYILPSTRRISGAVVVKYHHGEPVKGHVEFKFGYKESFETKTRLLHRSAIKTINSQTGRAEFNIPAETYERHEWFPEIANSRMFVEAIVYENGTSHRETAQDVSCPFITTPYMISFQDSIEDFKPGLTQKLTVKLVETVGLRPAPAGYTIFAQYHDSNGTRLSATDRDQADKPIDILDTKAVTDSEGRAVFNIGPVRDDIKYISITMKVYDQSMNDNAIYNQMLNGKQLVRDGKSNLIELASGRHTLSKHESQNGWISLMNKTITHLSVGDNFVSDLLIRGAVVVPHKIFYVILSKGHIITMNNLDSNGLVNFKVSESMMPSIRLVLFALTHDSIGLLSDSMHINIDQTLDCGMRMEYNKAKSSYDLQQTKDSSSKYARPNEEGVIRISARQGDVISLIGVDNAVFSVNNRSRLESNRIIERLKKLDSGCGFGGGQNNLDVFHNAGLMFAKDATSLGPKEVGQFKIGSSCLGAANILRYIEQSAMGFNNPILLQISREMQQQQNYGWAKRTRSKREVEVEKILAPYEDPFERACCFIGTLEDNPTHRNCTRRRRIVEKYMPNNKFCPTIYYDCCEKIYGETAVRMSTMAIPPEIITSRNEVNLMTSRSAATAADTHLPNLGQLDKIEAETLVRRDFRETWLFEVVEVDKSDAQGSASLNVRLPHSITSWSVSAMALNVDKPMCLLPAPLRIITFQEIFIHISMPYKVVQGEQIDLIATLFNYSPKSQDALVYMYGVEDVCSNSEPGERSERRRVMLERHSSQSLIFSMMPLKVGHYPIKLVAVTLSTNHSDIIERQLNVVPRGRPVTDEITFNLDPLNQQHRNKRAIHTGNLVDEIDSAKGIQHSKVSLIPTREAEYIVPQTQECIVSAIGDKMGQAVQTTILDVENLIRLPHGCGEQVMIYLGPTLYTARYLSATNKLTGDVRWRAIRYIQSGYKRILNFRNEHGAFSAFPKRDASIWLTAYVVKLLCQTERTPFIANEVYVDKIVIRSALKWLIEKQEKTGTWIELNPVYHREMLGGVLRENALTAFVTIALNECAHHSAEIMGEMDPDKSEIDVGGPVSQTEGSDKLKMATQKAEQALVLDWYRALREKNPYVLSMIAYALSPSHPDEAVKVLNDLMGLAERLQSHNHLFWHGDNSIETSAYALQALIELAPLVAGDENSRLKPNWLLGADAVAVSNWLLSRRSYSGAFESTQDTVVALEALSKFSQLQSTPNGAALVPMSPDSVPNLTCNVTVSNRTKRSLEFGKDNAQLLQTFKLDSTSIEFVEFMTSGTGVGIITVKLKYNVFQDEDELCRFNIDSSIEEYHNQVKLTTPQVTNNLRASDTPTNQQQQQSKVISAMPVAENIKGYFDKNMLNDLNLNELAHNDVSSNPQATKPQPKPEPILRLKRSSPSSLPTVETLSGTLEQNESMLSRAVTSIKSRFIHWMGPKTSSTSTTPAPPVTSTPNELHHNHHRLQRRNSTARRSTQTQAPMMTSLSSSSSSGGGIPPNAQLNNLSQEVKIFDHLEKNGTNITTIHQHIDPNKTRKLMLLLRVCAHHMSQRRDSEMAVIEIGILSGFKPNEADLKEILNDPGTPVTKYEFSNDRSLVIFYLEHIPYSGPYCFQFRLVRDSLVYNLQSGYIRVYEYYKPIHSCSNFYTPSRVNNLLETKCDASGQVCQCASRSLCPATRKLVDLSEIYQVNLISARKQFIDLTCKYDLVSFIQLKSVREVVAGQTYMLSVKVKLDLKGNLTKIIEAQRQQKIQLMDSIRKPMHLITATPEDTNKTMSESDMEETRLDFLNLSIDSSCIKNDPLLLHLAHPDQWRQGNDNVMILFARSENFEINYFKSSQKASNSPTTVNGRSLPKAAPIGPAPKGNIYNKDSKWFQAEANQNFDDAQKLQYSLTLPLNQKTILHDTTYQSNDGPREPMNAMIKWLSTQTRREPLACPPAAAAAAAATVA